MLQPYPSSSSGLKAFVLLIVAVVLTSMAAGTGWGIRGQYGHETGAMIAGTLAALTLVMLFIPGAVSLNGARAAAMMAVAIGIGGSMTYGQTVGLTHDRELVGNMEAWRWGMLGLFLKGGVWIGFGGLLLGMGLGGKRYRSVEMALLLLGAATLFFVGVRLLNMPFDPANRQLPWLYFSDHWDFEPEKFEAGEMKCRFETWGGYWLALIGMALYVRFVRGDRLAFHMAIFGIIGGGLGFSGGQCTQSAHSWHPEWFQEDGIFAAGAPLFARFNWWNIMETTFGCIWGAIVAFGLWLNRHLIDVSEDDNSVTLAPVGEMVLAVLYITLVLVGDFGYLNPARLPVDQLEYLETNTFEFLAYWYVEIGIAIAALPLIGICGGRILPYAAPLILIVTPICAKTLVAVGFSGDPVWHPGFAWFSLVQIPLAWALIVTAWLAANSERHTTGKFAAVALIFTTLVFVGLNTVFFNFAWPWDPFDSWGGRHPNQAFFMGSAACLIAASLLTLLLRPGTVRSAE